MDARLGVDRQGGSVTIAFKPMNNVLFQFSVQTVRSLASKKKLEEFASLLGSLRKDLIPSSISSNDPIHLHFSPESSLELLKKSLAGPRGGSVWFRFKAPVNGGLHLSTSSGFNSDYQGFTGRFDYSGTIHMLEDLERMILSFVRYSDAAYAAAGLGGGAVHSIRTDDEKANWGEMNGVPVPPINPSGIRFLTGIWWLNLFGREYIEFFSEEVLAGLPAYRAEFLDNKRWFRLQLTERPEDMLKPENQALAQDIKNRLGKPKAFAGHDPSKPSILCQFETPKFDFSEIRNVAGS